MKVLVTGATGFVGSCLARRLIRDGHDVHITTRSTSDTWRIHEIRKAVIEHSLDLRE